MNGRTTLSIHGGDALKFHLLAEIVTLKNGLFEWEAMCGELNQIDGFSKQIIGRNLLNGIEKLTVKVVEEEYFALQWLMCSREGPIWSNGGGSCGI